MSASPASPLAKWMIAVAILDAYRHSPTTTIAWRLLDHFNAKTRQCNPSFATLANGAGVDRRTAIRAVKRLEKDGWIAVEHRGPGVKGRRNTSNAFTFDWSRAGDTEDTRVRTH